MDKISVIVPCFNEEEVLPLFYKEVVHTLEKIQNIDYEILFINDGSQDHSEDILKLLAHKNKHCFYYSFSRNFGKEAAMYAGLENASGDYVVIMDADLQHPPYLLESMYQALKYEDYDCCAGKRIDRIGENKLRNFLSHSFYKVIQYLTKMDMDDGAGDFRMMTRQMVDAILELKEYNRFSKGLFGWVGFKTKWIEFENVERVAGETKWSLRKLFSYSLEGITGFSVAPLSLASVMGVGFCALAFIMIAVIIVRTLIWGDPVAGWPSMVCIIFLVSGVQLFCLGIVGEYLAKTYLETKHRPIFILKESKVQTAGKVAGDSFVGSGVNAVMREKKSGEESHEDKTVKASA